MRKITIVLISLIMFTLTGCSYLQEIKNSYSFNYTYNGENESWNAEYNVNGTIYVRRDNKIHYKSYCNNTLTVTYKGELADLSSVEVFDISYKSSISGGEVKKDLTQTGDSIKDKTFIHKSGSGGEIKIEDKDEIVKVFIDLDGNKESIELKSTE